jgi:predicted DNA-binding transcriptional regulator AlpA
MNDFPKLMNVEEVAAVTPFTVKTIRAYCAPKSKREFPIPVKRKGRKLYFRQQDVIKYLEE